LTAKAEEILLWILWQSVTERNQLIQNALPWQYFGNLQHHQIGQNVAEIQMINVYRKTLLNDTQLIAHGSVNMIDWGRFNAPPNT